jgi:hypothetical protein
MDWILVFRFLTELPNDVARYIGDRGLRMSSDGRPTTDPWWQVHWTALRPVGISVIV